MKDNRIVEAMDIVSLSELDSERILKKVVSKDAAVRRAWPKRLVAVSAILVVLVIAAGAAFAAQHIARLVKVREESQNVSLDGRSQVVITEYEAYDWPADEPAPYDDEWLTGHASDLSLTIASDRTVSVFRGLDGGFSSERELRGSGIPESTGILLPTYLPDGYEFETAYYELYITKENAEAAVKGEESFFADGYVYQNYLLPEDAREDVEALIISYRNSDAEQIAFMYQLVSDGENDSFTISATTDAVVSRERIAGFEQSVSIEDVDHNICVAANTIGGVAYVSENDIGAQEREQIYGLPDPSGGKLFESYYNKVVYSVKASAAPVSELIKMLESLD